MDDKNKKGPADEKIYSAADVRELIEQNRKLLMEFDAFRSNAAEGARRSPITEEIKQHVCTVLFIDDKPVIGLKNKGSDKRPRYLYEKQDPTRRNEYFLYADVIILTGEDKGKPKYETVTVEWGEFLENADRSECRIVESKKIPWEIEQGSTMRRVVDPDYKIEVDAPVPVIVKGYSQLLTVLLPTGEKVEIDEAYVNMSK